MPSPEPVRGLDLSRLVGHGAPSIAETITIRHSRPEDTEAVVRLAALDGQAPPGGDSLLAFVGEELRAALPLAHGQPIADPFYATAELLELTRLRATSWGGSPARRRRTLWLRLALHLEG
jgi:hypothetical protein